jgi:tetratricopeptide (TPR) repeat protein
LLGLVGVQFVPNASKKKPPLDFSDALSHCSPSGAGRMVGIVLRRTGRYEIARIVLEEALSLSGTPEERSAALQELSLLQQQQSGKRTGLARALVDDARKALGKKPDPWLQLNTDFGLLSMTIISLNSRPWLLFKIPGLFRKYKQHIEFFRMETEDRESTALHESLFNLYKGRLRYKLFGWLGVIIPFLAQWILEPFDIANAKIVETKDIHLHSRIDVLAYRAIAYAKLRHCSEAMKEISEIDRLVEIFNNNSRAIHWENQKKEIISQCIKHSS